MLVPDKLKLALAVLAVPVELLDPDVEFDADGELDDDELADTDDEEAPDEDEAVEFLPFVEDDDSVNGAREVEYSLGRVEVSPIGTHPPRMT